MIIDIHTHVAGLNYQKNGNYLSKQQQKSLSFRFFTHSMGFSRRDLESGEIDELFAQKVLKWVNESMVDRFVFLAFDAVYDEHGELNWDQTPMIVNNDYIANLANSNEKVLFGASVHPYRKDALTELERVKKLGACLIKWLPTGQNIDLRHPKALEFYDALKHYDLPLLCHTGDEGAILNLNNEMNNPIHLEAALEKGVTVIGAHCGSKTSMFETCYYHIWEEMTLNCDHFYGDMGAFCLPARVKLLKKLKAKPEIQKKMLYGSDFPVPSIPAVFFSHLGFRKALRLQFQKNPFDKNYLSMKHIGLDPAIFSRATDVLSLDGQAATA